VYRLAAQSLWLDEGSSWQFSQLAVIPLVRDLFDPTAAYPLYHLLLKAWVLIAGDSEIALRFPSALAGALAVVVIYLAALEVERAERRAKSGEQRAESRERRAESEEQRAESGERRAESEERRAESEERRAKSRERRAESGAWIVDRTSMSPCHPVTVSPGHPVTRSPSHRVTLSPYALAAALLVALGPFAIWYAQEAKVYSLLLLSSALIIWLALRTLRTNARHDWIALVLVIGTSLFVHRLSALLVLGVAWAAWAAWAVMVWRAKGSAATQHLALLRLMPVLLGSVSIGLIAAMTRGLGDDRAATGAYIPASPAQALWLTFVRFSVDRAPGDAVWWWLVPFAALFLLGSFHLIRAAYRGHTAALALLISFGVPLLLFSIQLLFTRLYEARYLMIVFPAWALIIAAVLLPAGAKTAEHSDTATRKAEARFGPTVTQPSTLSTQYSVLSTLLLSFALFSGGLALVQPVYGIFSGDPVKEQYREAIGELAVRVHPDDAIVLHPSYIRPLYDYYMQRFSTDPAPEPLVFADFWQGETSYGQREWDIERRAKLAGFTRSFVLIAPEHARTVDQPRPGDEYGLVGNFWAFSREQRAWPCGIWRFNGAHLLCQEAPEPYYTGQPAPQPTTSSDALFGEQVRLLGFTLKSTTAAGPGVYRAGGVLPISLFFDVTEPLNTDYSLFLHLCQDCEQPPLAGEDGPPLEGYLPTSSWLPGKPARDDRAIALPADLPPGQYTLLLGIYDPTDPTPAGRLSVQGAGALPNGRLQLATVEVTR
jgi:hypothetical protein